MNEKKKMYILLAVLGVILVSLIGVSIDQSIKQRKIYDAFLEKFNGTENALIYIGRPTCGYCSLLSPSLDSLKEHHNFDYYYINTDKVKNSTFTKIKEKLNLTEVGTPYLAVVSNGKVVDVQNGLVDTDALFNFLQKNNIIASEDKMLINYIDYNTYKTNLASSKLSITVVGKYDCIYCIKTKIALENIIANNNITVNYLSLNAITQTDYTELNTSLTEIFGNWGTPVMVLTKDGKVVDKLSGFAGEAGFIEFFKTNGVL